MKRKAIIRIPEGFLPQVEFAQDGTYEISLELTVLEIEACPLHMTDEFREFCHRADISETITTGAMESAMKAFTKTFAKLSVIEQLSVDVED